MFCHCAKWNINVSPAQSNAAMAMPFFCLSLRCRITLPVNNKPAERGCPSTLALYGQNKPHSNGRKAALETLPKPHKASLEVGCIFLALTWVSHPTGTPLVGVVIIQIGAQWMYGWRRFSLPNAMCLASFLSSPLKSRDSMSGGERRWKSVFWRQGSRHPMLSPGRDGYAFSSINNSQRRAIWRPFLRLITIARVVIDNKSGK